MEGGYGVFNPKRIDQQYYCRVYYGQDEYSAFLRASFRLGGFGYAFKAVPQIECDVAHARAHGEDLPVDFAARLIGVKISFRLIFFYGAAAFKEYEYGVGLSFRVILCGFFRIYDICVYAAYFSVPRVENIPVF